MLKQPIVYIQPGLEFSSWKEAWPNIQIAASPLVSDTPPRLVFVWAGLENWEEFVQLSLEQQQKVLIFAHKNTLEELQRTLSLGAHGYLDLTSSAATLLAASESVQHNSLWIPHSLLSSLVGVINSALPAPNQDPFSELTQRERQVTEAVCRGLTNKAIAAELDISERTVKQHLTSSFAKLGIKDRMQLLLLNR